MKLEFKKGVNEYANGEYHRKNDGRPFEVDARFAKEVLLPSGYFQEAKKAEEVKTEKVDKKEK